MIFDITRISLYFCKKYTRSMHFQEIVSYEKKYTYIRLSHLFLFPGTE